MMFSAPFKALPAHRTRKSGLTGYKNDGTVDWRNGGIDHVAPTTYQARRGGPPLLFMTDVRMSVLVTLAISPTPYRFTRLEELLGKKNLNPCINSLVKSGVLTTWFPNASHRIVDLDPAHPCFASLRRLLLKIATVYEFPKPLYLSENLFGGAAPIRRSRTRDARLVFGSTVRTLSLMAVYVLGKATMSEVARSVSILEKDAVIRTLWQMHAFGVIRAVDRGGRAGVEVEMNSDFEFAAELADVIADISAKLPMWAASIRNSREAKMPTIRVKRARKPGPAAASMRRWDKMPARHVSF